MSQSSHPSSISNQGSAGVVPILKSLGLLIEDFDGTLRPIRSIAEAFLEAAPAFPQSMYHCD